MPSGSLSPKAQAQAPPLLPAPAQHLLTSAGERPAPRGPRAPSHGAGSGEPGSALPRPPRPRCSSDPRGPSAAVAAPGPGQAGPGGRAEPQGASGPAPRRCQKGKMLSISLPTPSHFSPSLQMDTRTSDGETETRISLDSNTGH